MINIADNNDICMYLYLNVLNCQIIISEVVHCRKVSQSRLMSRAKLSWSSLIALFRKKDSLQSALFSVLLEERCGTCIWRLLGNQPAWKPVFSRIVVGVHVNFRLQIKASYDFKHAFSWLFQAFLNLPIWIFQWGCQFLWALEVK